MFRIAGLIIATVLLSFTIIYSNAPPEVQGAIPTPIKMVAVNVLDSVAEARNKFNGSIGTKFRQGLRRTTTDLKVASGIEEGIKTEGLVAINEQLPNKDFTAQLIADASFTRATLDGSNFTRTFMDGAAVDSASMKDANFSGTVLTNASARATLFNGSTFTEADLTNLMAQAADFSDTTIHDTLLSSSQFSGAFFQNSTLTDSYGDRSIFFSADFTGAKVSNTDFSRANFTKAKLIDAIFENSTFRRAVFDEADLSGADLSTAIELTQEQLALACGNENTKLPEPLIITSCDAVATTKEDALTLAEVEAAAEAINEELATKPEETPDTEDVVQKVAPAEGTAVLVDSAATAKNKPVAVQPASLEEEPEEITGSETSTSDVLVETTTVAAPKIAEAVPTLEEVVETPTPVKTAEPQAPATISAPVQEPVDEPEVDLNALQLQQLQEAEKAAEPDVPELDLDQLEKELDQALEEEVTVTTPAPAASVPPPVIAADETAVATAPVEPVATTEEPVEEVTVPDAPAEPVEEEPSADEPAEQPAEQ